MEGFFVGDSSSRGRLAQGWLEVGADLRPALGPTPMGPRPPFGRGLKVERLVPKPLFGKIEYKNRPPLDPARWDNTLHLGNGCGRGRPRSQGSIRPARRFGPTSEKLEIRSTLSEVGADLRPALGPTPMGPRPPPAAVCNGCGRGRPRSQGSIRPARRSGPTSEELEIRSTLSEVGADLRPGLGPTPMGPRPPPAAVCNGCGRGRPRSQGSIRPVRRSGPTSESPLG